MLEIAFGSRPMASAKFDSLAQLVEHFPYKEEVVGSKPTGITKWKVGRRGTQLVLKTSPLLAVMVRLHYFPPCVIGIMVLCLASTQKTRVRFSHPAPNMSP